MTLKGMGLLLCVSAFASPQQTRIPILDTSQSGSPVRFSGTATAEDEGTGPLRYSLKKDISFTNASTKDILLLVTTIDVTRLTKIDLLGTNVTDYFFTLDVFGPNAKKSWEESFGPFAEPQGKTELEPEEPRAVVKAVFVQFVDGSTWGEHAAGKDALRDRQLTMKELEVLAGTYRTEGSEQFVAELMKASQLAEILYLQRLYADSKDTEGMIAKIDNMLNSAELHHRAFQLG